MEMETLKIDPTIQYDIVELPSRGIYYENKIKSLKVSYLNASDENILASPNFLKTKDIVDEILKRKIISKEINVEDIVEEDRQAILLFLRNTSFGTEYNVTLIDPKTEKEFKATVDLSEINFKDFNLVPNEDNEYEFMFPVTKKKVTFKFLNKKQVDSLDTLVKEWNQPTPAPVVTKRLEMLIKSIDGERDQMKLFNIIQTLPILDSQKFREYVLENTPRLDLIREIVTPSNEKVQFIIGFGVEFFRPFYGYGT